MLAFEICFHLEPRILVDLSGCAMHPLPNYHPSWIPNFVDLARSIFFKTIFQVDNFSSILSNCFLWQNLKPTCLAMHLTSFTPLLYCLLLHLHLSAVYCLLCTVYCWLFTLYCLLLHFTMIDDGLFVAASSDENKTIKDFWDAFRCNSNFHSPGLVAKAN